MTREKEKAQDNEKNGQDAGAKPAYGALPKEAEIVGKVCRDYHAWEKVRIPD